LQLVYSLWVPSRTFCAGVILATTVGCCILEHNNCHATNFVVNQFYLPTTLCKIITSTTIKTTVIFVASIYTLFLFPTHFSTIASHPTNVFYLPLMTQTITRYTTLSTCRIPKNKNDEKSKLSEVCYNVHSILILLVLLFKKKVSKHYTIIYKKYLGRNYII
jgi:hypothetical protein